MRDHILILGGYGNFGRRIATALTNANIPVTICGRDAKKAAGWSNQLGAQAAVAIFDVNSGLDNYLKTHKPRIVINTCGPFQTADYQIAKTCIRNSAHYIDLSDGRQFVNGITALDEAAKNNNTVIIAGASSVPGLSSAVIEHYRHEFNEIALLNYGINPGQKAERGYATIKGIMTYVGKPLAPYPSTEQKPHGWQNIYRQTYPTLGKRWMANCEIPDLDLFPQKYAIKKIQFSAGMELSIIHLGLWALSGLVRMGVPLNLAAHTGLLQNMSNLFNIFGSSDGGMHIILNGTNHDGQPHTRKWFVIAKNAHGPHIPPVPTIILAKKLWRGEAMQPGAYPCVGLVSLTEYLHELEPYDIETFEQ